MVKKLKTVRAFATPESMEDMEAYLKKFSGSEAVVAHTCAFMMYNMMAEFYNTQCVPLLEQLDALVDPSEVEE